MKIEGDPDEVKRQSIRGAFYVYVRNGRTILSAWPRKRPGPMSQLQADAVDRFSQAATATKFMDSVDQNNAREWTKGTNALPRDLLMQALYGRLGDFFLTDGTRIYSMASLQDVTDLLDVLGFAPGSVIYRGTDYWAALPPGSAGQALTIGEDGFPVWAASGGGGGEVAANSTLLVLASSQSFTAGAYNYVTGWSSERDVLGTWDAGDPGKITVPAGVSMARLSFKTVWDNATGSGRYIRIIHKDSGGTDIRDPAGDFRTGQNESIASGISPWVPVTEGDYFQMRVNPGSSTRSLQGTGFGGPSFFQAEFV